MPQSCDLLIKNASQLITCEPQLVDSPDPEAESVGLIADGSVLISEGVIQWAGPAAEVADRASGAAKVIDATGMVVLPGLIDAHTHTVFAGTREREWEMRMRGVPYMEIARSGGGINSTVRSVRAASLDELVRSGAKRLRSMLRRGATTVEMKSGYGLDTDSELKMLEAIGRLEEETPAEVVPTFLGAHEIPPEFAGRRDRYVDVVIQEMIPAVSEQGIAEFCDVFCEQGVFTDDEARRILSCGKDFGLKPKIHADEFADSGAALVAGEVGAVSAGHLAFASKEGLEAMLEAGTVAVVLPGVSFGLGKCDFADARGMLDRGLDVAIATDFNPGSSMVDSLLIVSSLACSFMRMTPAEAILGITIRAARAVDRSDRIGSIAEGKQADLVIFDIPDFRYIPYHLGGDMVSVVIKHGEAVISNAQGSGA